VIWTLSANGKTNRAYASLKADYEIDKQVISTEIGGDNGSLRDELRDNIPPELRVDGPVQRTVKAGQPLELAVIAGDPDNLPARRDGRLPPGMRVPPPGNGRPPASAARGAAPPSGRGASPKARPRKRLPAPASPCSRARWRWRSGGGRCCRARCRCSRCGWRRRGTRRRRGRAATAGFRGRVERSRTPLRVVGVSRPGSERHVHAGFR
jgi:hypothetical protein